MANYSNIFPKTAAQVNKVLAGFGIQERLVRGAGYWYFTDGDSSRWNTSSVPVYRITSGSIEWWLTQWLFLAANEDDRSNLIVEYGENKLVPVLVFKAWNKKTHAYEQVQMFLNVERALTFFLANRSK